MSEWQPIATAPKDGTWLLLFEQHSFIGARIGHWANEIPGDEYDPKPIPAHWEDDGEGFTIQPTHWMPLPSPPEGA